MGPGVILLIVGVQLAASNDISSSLSRLLEGGGGNVAQVQRALLETLGQRATTRSGVVVTGNNPSVEEKDTTQISDEIVHGAVALHYLRVDGQGPEPLKVMVPVPQQRESRSEPPKAYQRIMAGVFLETDSRVDTTTGTMRFDCHAPGDYVVAAVPAAKKDFTPNAFLPPSPPPSRDPALRADWRLYRVMPEVITGATPLLLIHGVGSDRWADFVDWAANSPESAEFRERYQVWNYHHELAAVNAAIGFDPDCATYSETVVAALVDFLHKAESEGVETDGVRYYWPSVPFSILTSSSGGLKARAFMNNHPDYGARVLACVSLAGTHLGTPLATIEWLRHTTSRLGLGGLNPMGLFLKTLLDAEYFSTGRQSDLDIGWLNSDAVAGNGIPHESYRCWDWENLKWTRRTLSPRDGSSTNARLLSGFEDDRTFVPEEPLGNYCGGLDLITPESRGEMHTDKLFLYAGYVQGNPDILGKLLHSGDGVMHADVNFLENAGLLLGATVLGLFSSPGGHWPFSVYRINDGFVPLQSAFLCDGKMTEPVFKTWNFAGWPLPVLPLRPDMGLMRKHTLANPDRLRLYPGWTHLDVAATGRYNRATGHSEMFCSVAADLLSVL